MRAASPRPSASGGARAVEARTVRCLGEAIAQRGVDGRAAVTGTPLSEAGWLRFAGALLVDERGRYLLQRRDDRPDILHPGALGLFGGGLEAGESADQAMRRELAEEIGLVPGDLTLFRSVRLPVRLPAGGIAMAAVTLFEGSVATDAVAALTQREGAGRVLMPPALLLLEDRVALSARIGIALHAQGALACGAPMAEVLRWSA